MCTVNVLQIAGIVNSCLEQCNMRRSVSALSFCVPLFLFLDLLSALLI